MSTAEIAPYVVACTLVFVAGYSLVLGRLVLYPFLACFVAVFVAKQGQSEWWSVIAFVAMMFVVRSLVALSAAIHEIAAERRMKESK